MNNLILPLFYEEMTFFSWMGIAQALNGESSSYNISEKLLGNGSAGTRLDFPSHLNRFSQTTANAYGFPVDIALNHTVLPFYLAFRPHSYTNECIEMMCGDSVETLKFKLGITPSKIDGMTPLKYCPYCLEEDLKTIGIGYWHRAHQLPSCHYCTLHYSALEIIPFRSDGTHKNTIILPSLHLKSQQLKNKKVTSLLNAISHISTSLLHERLPNRFDPKTLQYTYTHGLHQQGLLTARGQIRVNEFLNRVNQHFTELKQFSPYESLLRLDRIPHFLKLVRKPRGHHHTVAHVLLIQFLFGTWELFNSVYLWESQFQFDFSSVNRIHELESINHDNVLNNIIHRYQSGESLTYLANELNCDVSTLLRRISKLGLVHIKRRPKKITKKIIDLVITNLKNGKSISETQILSNISESSIDRIIAANPEIRQIWQSKKFELLRDSKRETLNTFKLTNPNCCKSELRDSLLATYKWLLKNDADWLNDFITKLPKKSFNRNAISSTPRINWALRDQICLDALITLRSFEPESWERVKPPMYLRRLNLSFKPRLDKLPMSQAWITSSLSRLNNDR